MFAGWPNGELRFEEVKLPAYPLAELLVDKTTFTHRAAQTVVERQEVKPYTLERRLSTALSAAVK